MSGIVVDSCVVGFATSPHHKNYPLYAPLLLGRRPVVSFITIDFEGVKGLRLLLPTS